jgi:hypothetical protein
MPKTFKQAFREVLSYPKGPLTEPFKMKWKVPPSGGFRRYSKDQNNWGDYAAGEWTDATKAQFEQILSALKSHLEIKSEPGTQRFYAEMGIALMRRHVPAFQIRGEPGAPRKSIEDCVLIYESFLSKKFALESKFGPGVEDSRVYVEMSKLSRFKTRDGKSSPGAVKKLVERAKRDIWGKDGKSGTISNPARDKKQ